MSTITVILIALGLAMDALAVSIASGAISRNLKIQQALRIALSFGLFQAFMPLIGWLAGRGLQDYIRGLDHWIAFSLLPLIGVKMIYESFSLDTQEKENNPLNLYVLLMLSLATSIDALAVGVSFALLKILIATAVIIIGAITFLVCFAGIYVGNRFGHLFENKIEIAGGMVLIGMGIKILMEHLG